MKLKLMIAAAWFCACHLSYAQKPTDKTVFLDSLGFETTEGNHFSYRVIEDYAAKKKEFQVKEYYKSGKLLMEGTFLDNNAYAETGVITYYYENGNKKKMGTYAESVPLGNVYTWYENGSKKTEGEYLKNTEKEKDKKKMPGALKINSFWDKDNKQTVTDGNGDYEEAGKKFTASGKLKDGFKDGVWTGKDDEIKYTFSETYANSKLVSGTSIDSSQVQHTYTEVEIRPDFKGGLTAFYKYIASNFKTPDEDGLNGRIVLVFFIGTDGKISDVEVTKDIGYGTGEEALRVMNTSPDWKPGITRGIPVKVRYSMPITIRSAD